MSSSKQANSTDRIWLFLWALLALLLLLRTGLRPANRGVILDHLEFGRRLLLGEDLYAPYLESEVLHAPYPPSFGLLTAPFSLLPQRLARFAWGLLQVCCLFSIGLHLRSLLETFKPQLERHLHLVLMLTALVASRYILRDTHGGGGNLLNLALVVTSIGLAAKGRATSSGILLGFSLATKPTSILIVPLLWLFGHRRAACTAVLASLGFVALALLLLRQGMAPFLQWFEGSVSYGAATDLFATPSHGFPPFTWMNQCLRCAVTRYAGVVPPDLQGELPFYFEGLALSPTATSLTASVLGLLLLALTAFLCWRRRRNGNSHPYQLASVLALSLLLSPISWKAHHVALIPAFFLLILEGFSGRRWPWFFLLAYFLLCVVGEQVLGKELKNLQQSLYLTTAGTVAILGIMLTTIHRMPGSPLPPRAEPR